jgi:Na+/melibiose symporter-like transporter
MVSQNCKLASSIIAGVLLSFSTNSIYSLASISMYIISYHQVSNPKLTLAMGYLVFPIINGIAYMVTPLLKILIPILDFHLTIVCGSLINVAATVVLFFSPNAFVTFAAFVIFGCGLGISVSIIYYIYNTLYRRIFL